MHAVWPANILLACFETGTVRGLHGGPLVLRMQADASEESIDRCIRKYILFDWITKHTLGRIYARKS